MSTETLVSGTVASVYTSALSTELNSLANGNAILGGTVIDNTAAGDEFIDISFSAGGTATTAAPNFIGIYLYPIGQDGSTYGDGRFGAAAAGPPPGNYLAGTIGFNAAAGTTITGVVNGASLYLGKQKVVVWSQAGATLPASNNTCYYKTYKRQVA